VFLLDAVDDDNACELWVEIVLDLVVNVLVQGFQPRLCRARLLVSMRTVSWLARSCQYLYFCTSKARLAAAPLPCSPAVQPPLFLVALLRITRFTGIEYARGWRRTGLLSRQRLADPCLAMQLVFVLGLTDLIEALLPRRAHTVKLAGAFVSAYSIRQHTAYVSLAGAFVSVFVLLYQQSK
jgi:hypothetical protein